MQECVPGAAGQPWQPDPVRRGLEDWHGTWPGVKQKAAGLRPG